MISFVPNTPSKLVCIILDKLKVKDNNYYRQNIGSIPKSWLMQKKNAEFPGLNFLGWYNYPAATVVAITIRFSRILALLPLRLRW